jgi:hypothetical protein
VSATDPTDDEGGTEAAAEDGRARNDLLVITLATIAMVAVTIVLVASLIDLWPSVEAATGRPAGTSARKVGLLLGALRLSVQPETALLLLVLIVGALGSLVHTATSLGDFIGNRRFYSSWIAWYLLRPFVGSLLAILLYFAIRGGFFSGSSGSSSVNPYGIAAVAGLAGLFSKQATDKLREVFETLFRVSDAHGDAQRSDDLEPPG